MNKILNPSKNKFLDFSVLLLLYTIWNVLISFFYYSFLQDLTLTYQFSKVTLLDIFETAIFSPIWEEFVYRWAPITIVLTIFERRGPHPSKKLLWPVIIISSYIFGWGHDGNGIENLLLQGVGGIFMSVLYIRTNNIKWNILFHICWNIFCLFYWDQFNFV